MSRPADGGRLPGDDPRPAPRQGRDHRAEQQTLGGVRDRGQRSVIGIASVTT
jgi:hypothetical protein